MPDKKDILTISINKDLVKSIDDFRFDKLLELTAPWEKQV